MRRVLPLLAILMIATGCPGKKDPPNKEVVVFVSHDRVFSEPVLKDFEKKTGIKVKPVYDTEATKTTGLVNRLLGRKGNPEADVFWNNEVGQTLVLKDKGILEKYVPKAAEKIPSKFMDMEGWWTGYAVRARVILINTDMVEKADYPRSIHDLVKPKWKGKVAVARPLFGTTKTHFAALFHVLGPENAKAWLKKLKANDVQIVEGNAVARNLVMDGKLPVCLTDTDDANGAFLKGKPVEMIYPDQDDIGTLLVPNTVCLIKGGPNPEAARELIEYLLSREVEERLAKSKAAQMPVRKGIPSHSERFRLEQIRGMDVTPEQIAAQMEPMREFVEAHFNR